MSTKSEDARAEFRTRFVIEYLRDLNGTAAVRRIAPAQKHPGRVAYELLSEQGVQDAIAKGNAERKQRVTAEADTVLRELIAIATCDTNEIVEIRRGCCRHCHGVEHRYQYRDERELARARRDWDTTDEALVGEFDHGGIGFDPKLEPHGECTACGGEGNAFVHVKDTRNLSPAARSLFAGAKQTKDGIEVKLHDKTKHLELLGRHLALFTDKVEVTGNMAERLLAARKRVRGS